MVGVIAEKSMKQCVKYQSNKKKVKYFAEFKKISASACISRRAMEKYL